ncbi:hypothetical protein [Acidovorax sp.]|uniref:hypothetical protein n=1 Tax=Acidovorax sp. TaxID=1872122 RepID=UPI00391B73EE
MPLRTFLWALSGIGTLLFGGALLASLLNPLWVERVARDILRQQIESRVGEKLDALNARALTTRAGAVLQSQAQEAQRIRQMLASQLPERIGRVMADMADADCECRKKVEGAVRSGLESRAWDLQQQQERLNALIRTQYLDTAQQLTREFRIFTGSNALAFVLLGLALGVRRSAGAHLVPAAAALLLATAVTSYLYLFEQNWLHTVLFSSYLGWGFVAYLALLYAWLCDVLFNRARITCEVLNAASSGLEVVPC